MSQTRRLAAILAADVAGYRRSPPIRTGSRRNRSVGQRNRYAEFSCHRLQAPVARPQFGLQGQACSRQQMGIDIGDAAPEQRFPLDQIEHFLVLGNDRLRQVSQVAQKGIARTQIAERELAQHEWMTEDLTVVEQFREDRIGQTKMIDPDRRVDKDHLGFGRRRGIGLRSG